MLYKHSLVKIDEWNDSTKKIRGTDNLGKVWWIEPTAVSCSFLQMKKKDKEELQKLTDEILQDASLVVKDYVKNPSELSGSTIQIHPDRPLLDKK